MNSKAKLKITLLIVACLVVLFLLFQWLKPDSAESAENSQRAAQDAEIQSENMALQQSTTVNGSSFASKSQQDIQINCQIQTDNANRLIVNENTKNCFEFFITQYGEKEIPQIKADFIKFAQSTYQEPLLGQLTDLWSRYVQYREKMGDLTPPNHDKESAQYYKAIFNQMKSLRKQFFSDYEIEGLFGIEDEYHDYTLARMSVMEDKNLSEKQKADKLKELFNDLPEDWKENLKQLSQLEDLRQLTAEIKARGGSAEEIRQMRLSLVGPEATQRLENLDGQRSNWKSKVNQYLSERDSIVKSNMSPSAKQEAVQRLRSQHFNNSQEQLRVETFEQVHDQGGQLPFAD